MFGELLRFKNQLDNIKFLACRRIYVFRTVSYMSLHIFITFGSYMTYVMPIAIKGSMAMVRIRCGNLRLPVKRYARTHKLCSRRNFLIYCLAPHIYFRGCYGCSRCCALSHSRASATYNLKINSAVSSLLCSRASLHSFTSYNTYIALALCFYLNCWSVEEKKCFGARHQKKNNNPGMGFRKSGALNQCSHELKCENYSKT